MRKQSKSVFFLTMVLFFTSLNFYFSNLIFYKLAHGWHFLSPVVNIIYAENTGAAFSLMQNATIFLIIISIIAAFAILYYIIKNLDIIRSEGILFLSLLMSGVLGNLYERIFLGYVRDFFDLRFINFPIFNISDIFINIGVLGIIIMILLTKKPIKLL